MRAVVVHLPAGLPRALNLRSLLLFSTAMVLIPAARADISSTLTVDGCSSGCGSGPYGTVLVQNVTTDQVKVTVNLAANEVFANTGAGGMVAFAFNTNESVTLDTSPAPSPTGFTYALGGAQTYHPLSMATFSNSIECTDCGNGTSPPVLTSPLIFYLSNSSGLSSSNFLEDSEGFIFAADIGAGYNSTTGEVTGTGVVGANSFTNVVPEPEYVSFLLVVSLGIVSVGLRRRRLSS